MQLYTVYFICKLLYMFRVVSPPIIRSTNNCVYSIWYWSTVAAACRYRGGPDTDLRVPHTAHLLTYVLAGWHVHLCCNNSLMMAPRCRNM